LRMRRADRRGEAQELARLPFRIEGSVALVFIYAGGAQFEDAGLEAEIRRRPVGEEFVAMGDDLVVEVVDVLLDGSIPGIASGQAAVGMSHHARPVVDPIES